MTTRSPRLLLAAGIVFGVFLIGFAAGRTQTGQGSRQEVGSSLLPDAINVSLLQEVWDVLHQKYAGQIDDERLGHGVLEGLVRGLDDPYSAYADPMETAQFEEDLSGSITGIGVEIGVRRGLVTIIAPLNGSPAERVGIRAGDVVVAVDGEELTTDTSLTDVVSRIRGPVGTSVTIKVLREGETEVRTFTIQRDRIEIQSVESRRDGDIGIIELTAFHEDTTQRFRRVVRDLLSQGVKGIVLDLRNNPGGILDGAVAIAGHFVAPNTVVVKEVPADPAQTMEHRSRGPADLERLPVVILVNEGSASAAEILAGALRDIRQVPLIGAETFGKGSVQELVDLSDGSSIRVTIAKWVTPSGKQFSEEGLKPDIESRDEDLNDDTDVVLQRGLEELRPKLRQGL